jgi:HEPN domain-containing protein
MNTVSLQQQATTQLPIPTPSAIGYGYSLGNDTPYNFAVLAEEFLTAAKVLNAHEKNYPSGPTYFLIFQALELQLKSFLRGKGVSLRDLSHKIGHSIQTAIEESEKRGLNLDLDPKFRQSLMEFGEAHRRRDHLYRRTRKGFVFRPTDLIDLVDKVRSDCKRANS